MARRMFSDEITTSDAFLDMGAGSQLLYFHLGMGADDDGFVANPKMVMRIIGASEDDYKILMAKKFIIVFGNGICVIKAWRMNNQIRADRYKTTKYTKEKATLFIEPNGMYTTNPENALPVPNGHFTTEELFKNISGNQLATSWQPSIGKDSIGKDSETLSLEKTFEYLKSIPEADMNYFKDRFDVNEKQIKSKAEDLSLYCKTHGRKYKNYKTFLLNAVKKDFKERVKTGDYEFIPGVGRVKKI